LPVDVREDCFEERGAGDCGAGVVEHVNVPEAGGEGVDGRIFIIVLGLIIDGHPVMEGGDCDILVVRVRRDG
jgi:hypothetical protein